MEAAFTHELKLTQSIHFVQILLVFIGHDENTRQLASSHAFGIGCPV